jgi:hypothetical protein
VVVAAAGVGVVVAAGVVVVVGVVLFVGAERSDVGLGDATVVVVVEAAAAEMFPGGRVVVVVGAVATAGVTAGARVVGVGDTWPVVPAVTTQGVVGSETVPCSPEITAWSDHTALATSVSVPEVPVGSVWVSVALVGSDEDAAAGRETLVALKLASPPVTLVTVMTAEKSG